MYDLDEKTLFLHYIEIEKLNSNKQIEYWITTAADDLNSAELLISHKKILHGLFF